jgi:predicted dehydrogenase
MERLGAASAAHVWNEKPIALDRKSGRELLDAARGVGLRVDTLGTFHGPGIQTARRLIKSDVIGTPLTALTLMQGPCPESWHPDPPSGPLFDIGPCHLTALVQLFGPVSRVIPVGSQAKAVRHRLRTPCRSAVPRHCPDARESPSAAGSPGLAGRDVRQAVGHSPGPEQ